MSVTIIFLLCFVIAILACCIGAAVETLIAARRRSASIRAEQRAIEEATRAFQEKCRARSENFWRDFSGGGK